MKNLLLFQLIVLCVGFGLLFSMASSQNDPMKNGFYKISSLLDGSVLTATWNGKGPTRDVITSPWKDTQTQVWKIKTKYSGNMPFQIIRNEEVRNNELTKEPVLGRNDEVKLVEVEWNLIPISKTSNTVFMIHNGMGLCLQRMGKGTRISTEAACDSTRKSQQWDFEFLYEIPAYHTNVGTVDRRSLHKKFQRGT